MSWKSFDVFQSGLQVWIKVAGQEIRQMEAHLKTQTSAGSSQACTVHDTSGVQRGKAGGKV